MHTWGQSAMSRVGQITYMIPESDGFVRRGLWTPCVCRWMHREDRAPHHRLVTTLSLSFVSSLCKYISSGDLRHSPVYKPLRKQECRLNYFFETPAVSAKSWVQAREWCCTGVQALPFSLERGNPFLNESNTDGLSGAAWSVNANAWYWHTVLCTVM